MCPLRYDNNNMKACAIMYPWKEEVVTRIEKGILKRFVKRMIEKRLRYYYILFLFTRELEIYGK